MKISYRTHPALQIIKNGNLNSMLIDAIDLPHFKTKGEAINRHFKFWAPIFSEEITFITAPFVSALEKHWTKFKSLYRDILENNVTALTVKGTFIFKGIVHALHFNLPAGKNPEVVLFVFGKDGSLIAYSIDNFSGQGKLECWLCKRFVSNEDDNEYINEDYKSFVINNRTVIQY